MIYGLYSSAAGMITSSHRQDVVANNLANIETGGFKRALSLVQTRAAESVESGRRDLSNPQLDAIGGGMFLSPTRLDFSQGPMERSDAPLHASVSGDGFFGVEDQGQFRLTRNGSFMLDRSGRLILPRADGSSMTVLDARRRPITLNPTRVRETSIDEQGQISIAGQPVAKLGLFTVADKSELLPAGGNTFRATADALVTAATTARVQAGFLEGSNVNAPAELAQMLDAQRQIDANANMLRYQDQTLGKLVNEVGKIG